MNPGDDRLEATNLDRILRATSAAAARFLRMTDWRRDVDEFLAGLGGATDVDRAYLCEIRLGAQPARGQQDLEYEWSRAGTSPSHELGEKAQVHSRLSPLEQCRDRLAAGEVIQTARDPTGPPDATMFHDFLASRGTRTSLYVPVFAREGWWGLLGLEACRAARPWSLVEIDSLKLSAAVLGAAIDRREVENALRRSEELYRGLFENADDFVYTHDLNGNYTSMNQAGAALTGYSMEELMNMSSADLVAPEYCDLARKMTQLKVRGKADTTSYELEIITKDGRRLTADVSSRVVEDEGKPVAIQGIARDITEKKRFEARLRRAQKMEAIGKLAGGVAHDFNNLLTVINGNCDRMLSRPFKSERLRGELEDIREAGQQAADLTRQLLAFSSQQVMMPRVLDLNSVVLKIERMLRRVIGEDIELETRLSPDIGMVRADSGQIEQVIMNLIINARDGMPTGGLVKLETEAVDIETATLEDSELSNGPYVRLRVSDSGQGMDAATLAQLFEPFFTTKERGKGTGLGLSTVYGIVHQCGGGIQADSELGRGSTFDVYLPKIEGQVDRDDRPQLEPKAVSSSETLLLVEDEEMVRTLTQRVLLDQGYEVIVARTPHEALELVRPGIDLLITDVVMPGMSGPDLADRIGGELRTRRVIFMSGYTESFIGRHGLLDTKTRFLAKPFTPGQLLTEVRSALDAESDCEPA